MPHPTTAAAVRHPETGEFVALNPAIDYESDDPLVVEYAWAFEKKSIGEPVESVRIEKAEARPGQKRNVRRGR